jgi:hypothetical protein
MIHTLVHGNNGKWNNESTEKGKERDTEHRPFLESMLPQGLAKPRLLLFQFILQMLKQLLCSPSSRNPSNGLQVA